MSEPRFYKAEEVAGILMLSIGTLRRWRSLDEGPTWVKLGGSIRYPIDQLDIWLKSRPLSGDGSQT